VRTLYLLGLTYLALSAYALWRGPARSIPEPAVPVLPIVPVPAVPNPGDPGAWFQRVKPYCNSLEVETTIRARPAPRTVQGAGYEAACWALAGRMAEARARILELQPNDRWSAVGIVFEIGHPIADMGDDRSAGPIMELVVEFWPNHYMALYHAGAARYALGDRDAARRHLVEFLKYYHENDGWTGSARTMLAELGAR
jgi:hypothetical protein